MDPLASLKKRLVQDGFDQKQVMDLFQPQPALSYQTVALTLRIREGKLNYDQFLSPVALAKARDFLRSNEGLLAKAEETYAVDRRVVTAILLVETGFGSYTGKTPTLGILATFAIMDEKGSRDRVWRLLTPRTGNTGDARRSTRSSRTGPGGRTMNSAPCSSSRANAPSGPAHSKGP